MVQTKKKNNRLGNAYSNTIKAVDITGNVGKITPIQQKSIVQAPSTTSTPTPTPTQTSSNLKSTYDGVKGLDEYKNLVNQRTSALSNLKQANQLAMKYADNTALAQGYATQGAMLQNNANLQSAYINQAGGINQNFQKQLGSLVNTTSQQELKNQASRINTAVENGTLNQAYLDQVLGEAKNSGLMQDSDYNNLVNFGKDALRPFEQQEQTTTETGTLNQGTLEEAYSSKGIKISSDDKGITTELVLNTANPKYIKEQLGDKIGQEDLNGLKNLINSGTLKDYDVIAMSGKQYVYINGRLYKTSKAQSTYSIGLGKQGYVKSQ